MEIETFLNLMGELNRDLEGEKEQSKAHGQHLGVEAVLKFLQSGKPLQEFLSTTERWRDWVEKKGEKWEWATWHLASDNIWKKLEREIKQK